MGPLVQADSAITLMLTASHTPITRRMGLMSICLIVVPDTKPVNF